MKANLPRRAFLVGVPMGLLSARALAMAAFDGEPGADAPALHRTFPAQDPALVRSIVAVSHRDADAVKELITARPALAKAAWDWGFGDWETALGAASHVGRHDIVELLLAHGARPDVFTFAMLDNVDAVRAIIEAAPGPKGVERIHGPHGITLMAHARNGEAQRVIDYLQSIPGADVMQTNLALDEESRKRLAGSYAFGPGERDRLTVEAMKNGNLAIARDDAPRQLMHLGDHTFHPTGAPAVRIFFKLGDNPAGDVLSVHDADLIVTARRIAGA